jgi:uncharacterized protein (TIGR03067 family)
VLSHVVITLALAVPWIDDPTSDRYRSDQERILGVWDLVSIKTEGQDAPVNDPEDRRLLITKDHFKPATEPTRPGLAYKLDPSKNPKQLDLVLPGPEFKGQIDPCIYKIEGDTLTICGRSGSAGEKPLPRPTRFSSEASERTVLHVYNRVKNL